ncbi:type II toxin-antitoxin system VapB family antitoxin [bacterium]|nr:type II toxin-antitoxin system VapB family antitoxin [bacterium]
MKSGRTQTIHLPKSYRFNDKKVFVKRMGNAIVLLPHNDPWRSLFASVHRFTDDFMEVRGQPNRRETR